MKKNIIKLFIVFIIFLTYIDISNANIEIPNNRIDKINNYIKDNIEVNCFYNNKKIWNASLICEKWENNWNCKINLEVINYNKKSNINLECKIYNKENKKTFIQKIEDKNIIYKKIEDFENLLTPISYKNNPLNKDFIPKNLVSINNYSKENNLSLRAENDDIKIKSEIINNLDNFIKSCKNKSNNILITSWYRSYEEQEELFKKLWWWDKWVAKAWYSEHQTWFAVDIKTDESTTNCLHSNMTKYWFILSYPEWNKYLNWKTIYEPWHFRYLWNDIAKMVLLEDMINNPLEFLENIDKYKKEFENKNIIDRTKDFKIKSLQTKIYSCEISATSDILSNIFNKKITEDELIEKIDKSKFWEKAKLENWIWIWWNPNEWFVWFIDKDDNWRLASQRNLTWYWVYEKPISKIYNWYNLNTKIISNLNYSKNYWLKQHLTEILWEFEKWNYIQLWFDICTKNIFDDWELKLTDITQNDVDNGKNAKNTCWSYWKDRKVVWYYENNWNLNKIQWLIWEHNWYILWFTWSKENPKTIILWDTSTWKHEYPISEFLRKWEEMDYRSIIIYK